MKYLSFDLEATGLREHDLIIEFAAVPFDCETQTIAKDLSFHCYVQCPPFDKLKDKLDPWVIEHNKTLIEKAHSKGFALPKFKKELESYLTSKELKKYFALKEGEKMTLFGKSMNAIDLPFLNRDLGWDFMRQYFTHRELDLSSVAYSLIDLNLLPEKCSSGSELMKYVGLGDVCHTALEDAINTAHIYLKLLEKFKQTSAPVH